MIRQEAVLDLTPNWARWDHALKHHGREADQSVGNYCIYQGVNAWRAGGVDVWAGGGAGADAQLG